MKDIQEYQCSLCGEADEDPWHLWEWCPRLTEERMVIRKMLDNGLDFEIGILKLMNTKKLDGLWAENESLLVT